MRTAKRIWLGWTGPVLACLAVLPAAGCSNTCTYGSQGRNPGSKCKSRPDPTAAETRGWGRRSLSARLGAARSKVGGGPVTAVAINRWGELGVLRDHAWIYTSNSKGEPIEHEDQLGTVIGSGGFALARIDPAVPERVMGEIKAREPRATFISATAMLAHPRRQGGVDITRNELRWTLTAAVGHTRYDYYEADPGGRLQCVVTSSDASGHCRGLG